MKYGLGMDKGCLGLYNEVWKKHARGGSGRVKVSNHHIFFCHDSFYG